VATEFLNRQMISLSNDTLAVLDRAGGKCIHLLDAIHGKPLGAPLTHMIDINDVALNQAGPATERQLIFIDANRALYITPVLRRCVVKLCSIVDSAMWHEGANMLAAVVSEKL
ncbi:unnamed protein product, partial [Ostreobium quekettii]